MKPYQRTVLIYDKINLSLMIDFFIVNFQLIGYSINHNFFYYKFIFSKKYNYEILKFIK